MSNRLKGLAIGLSVSLIGVSMASADDHRSRPGPERFAEMDANDDGAISLDEAMVKPLEHFSEADLNQDGGVTAEEFAAAQEAKREERRRKRHARMFDALDSDNDGIISAEEFSARAEARFDRMDADNDGLVTEEEAKEGRRRGHHRRHGFGRSDAE